MLARIEFNGKTTPAILGPDLLKLNEAELGELCATIVEPGTGDDTKARMALQALTFYVSKEGTPDDRGRLIDVLCQALHGEKPAAVKQFYIERLQLVGDDRAVETLASFVLDPELGSSAVSALLAMKTAGSSEALFQALRNTDETNSLALMSALLQCDKAPPRHVLLALKLENPDNDHERRHYGIDFLALLFSSDLYLAFPRLEDMTTAETWQKIVNEKTWWERSQIVATILSTADALARDNQNDKAVTLCRRMMELNQGADSVHIRCAALYGLVHAAPQEAVHDIVIALADENPELRAAALELGVGLPGPEASRALAGELVRSLPPTAVGILEVLGRRRDPSAFGEVIESLENDHQDVRVAAVRAAAAIDPAAALAPLAVRLNCEEDEERSAVADALVGLRGIGVTPFLADGLADAPPWMKCGILGVLTRRNAVEKLDTIVKYMRHEDSVVRVAAIESVGALAADLATVQRLIQLIGEITTDDERAAAEQALVAVCLRCPNQDDAIDVVLDKLDSKQTAAYCALLSVLGRLPGRPAFSALETAVHDLNAEIRAAALHAMGSRPDPTLRDAAMLLETARGFDELTEHVLTMRAFADFVARCTDESAADRLALFDAGLAAARRDEERKLLLSKIAEVRAHETIEYFEDYLQTPKPLVDEAASGMLRVADELLPHDWQLATEVAEQVAALNVPETLHQQARLVLEHADQSQGYVVDWLVAGPYTVENKSGFDLMEEPFAPEKTAAATVEWKPQPRTPDKDDFWHVDLLRSGGRDDSAMYLRTYVWSPAGKAAMLEIGSDDGVKAWLNGTIIHDHNVPRGCAPAQDKVAADLHAGWNEILLKVVNGNGGFGACLRVRAADGMRIDGLKISPDPNPDEMPSDDESDDEQSENLKKESA